MARTRGARAAGGLAGAAAGLLALAGALGGAEASALLLVEKSAPLKATSGKELPVTVTIYNVGEDSAIDVELGMNAKGGSLPLSHVRGESTKRFSEIAPGDSVSHTEVVRCGKDGVLTLDPAQLTYNRGDGGRTAAQSTQPTAVLVVTGSVALIESLLQVGSVLTLGLVTNLTQWWNLGFTSLLVGGTYFGLKTHGSIQKAREDHARTASLKALGLDKPGQGQKKKK